MADKHDSGAIEVFRRFLRCSETNAWDDLADLYAEDATIEMPFVPPGMPTTTRGRAAHRARFRRIGTLLRFTSATSVRLHQTTDPDVIIAEYDLHGEVIANGTTFVLSYVMVVTVRNGEIVHSRDYGNSLNRPPLDQPATARR
ncbi:nuclear transport factor 2 family protein [Actinophytocola sediminis]